MGLEQDGPVRRRLGVVGEIDRRGSGSARAAAAAGLGIAPADRIVVGGPECFERALHAVGGDELLDITEFAPCPAVQGAVRAGRVVEDCRPELGKKALGAAGSHIARHATCLPTVDPTPQEPRQTEHQPHESAQLVEAHDDR